MSTDAVVGDSSLAKQVYDAKDPDTSFPPDNIRFRSRDWLDDPHRKHLSCGWPRYFDARKNSGLRGGDLLGPSC